MPVEMPAINVFLHFARLSSTSSTSRRSFKRTKLASSDAIGTLRRLASRTSPAAGKVISWEPLPIPDCCSQSYRASGRRHASKLLPDREQVRQPWIVGLDALHDTLPGAHDLRQHQDQRVQKAAKLHVQQRHAPFALRQQQPISGFQIPDLCGDRPIGPVAHRIVHRHARRIHPVLQLLDDVFLVAALVGQHHHRFVAIRAGAVGW